MHSFTILLGCVHYEGRRLLNHYSGVTYVRFYTIHVTFIYNITLQTIKQLHNILFMTTSLLINVSIDTYIRYHIQCKHKLALHKISYRTYTMKFLFFNKKCNITNYYVI